uniref:Reverse transcriptase domain-containing protein n=1 Tax=Tanacetum cinerariifolium TaxID=118510 RepID=A0A699H5L9_TANCI|nr:reverse transcriptase domain-containing protein [Tanacetum cinerariifolium]
MDLVKSPELAKCFLDKVPTTVNEMMERLDDFVRSEEAYASTELPKGETRESRRKISFPSNGRDVWLLRNTRMMESGRDDYQNRHRGRDTEATEPWMNIPTTFLAISAGDIFEKPLIVEAKLEGYLVRRVYVDEGSSVEVMFEHYFENLNPKIKAGLRETQTDLGEGARTTINFMKVLQRSPPLPNHTSSSIFPSGFDTSLTNLTSFNDQGFLENIPSGYRREGCGDVHPWLRCLSNLSLLILYEVYTNHIDYLRRLWIVMGSSSPRRTSFSSQTSLPLDGNDILRRDSLVSPLGSSVLAYASSDRTKSSNLSIISFTVVETLSKKHLANSENLAANASLRSAHSLMLSGGRRSSHPLADPSRLLWIFVQDKMNRDMLTVGSTMMIPLLYRGEYSQWVERFRNYLEEQTDGKVMINSIKNGDQPLPRVTQVSTAGTSSPEQPPLKDKSMWSDQEKKIQKIDRLARSLLIQRLPNDIYSLIDRNKTAKDLWDALARHMLGSEYGEQDRKAIILYEYETFKATEGELLLNTYIRYLQVINDLKKCGYSKDNCELNFKFLNNLQPEWKQYATMMRQNKKLMDINIDALYNILKQNQGDVNDAMRLKKKLLWSLLIY